MKKLITAKLNEISDIEIRNRALANINPDCEMIDAKTISTAIALGMKKWRDTPEGFKFWCKFHDDPTLTFDDLKHLIKGDIPTVNIEAILRRDEPYPLVDVLKHLVTATEKLLHQHAYDGHDYEEMEGSVKAAKEIIATLSPQSSSTD